MRAILIDTPNKEIVEVDVDGSLDSFYETIGCSDINSVRLSPSEYLWVDGESLLLNKQLPLFQVAGYPDPLMGKGLILGVSHIGDNQATKLSVEFVRERVKWRDDLEFTHLSHSSSEIEHPILGKMNKLEVKSNFRKKS